MNNTNIDITSQFINLSYDKGYKRGQKDMAEYLSSKFDFMIDETLEEAIKND